MVDGGASLRCALLGDLLAARAVENAWRGIIINGCIRDSANISMMNIGVKALATHPLPTSQRHPVAVATLLKKHLMVWSMPACLLSSTDQSVALILLIFTTLLWG